jgi:hypothetical protein
MCIGIRQIIEDMPKYHKDLDHDNSNYLQHPLMQKPAPNYLKLSPMRHIGAKFHCHAVLSGAVGQAAIFAICSVW